MIPRVGSNLTTLIFDTIILRDDHSTSSGQVFRAPVTSSRRTGTANASSVILHVQAALKVWSEQEWCEHHPQSFLSLNVVLPHDDVAGHRSRFEPYDPTTGFERKGPQLIDLPRILLNSAFA